MSNLDEFVKRHDEMCTCRLMCTDDLKYCDCGYTERVDELAKLRADLDKARNLIGYIVKYYDETVDYYLWLVAAIAWVQKEEEK
jgi:hypothetical protein